MTDHAQRARAMLDELRNIVELHNGNDDEMLTCATTILAQAHADGRRAGLVEAARDAEAHAWEQAAKLVAIPEGWEFRPVELATIHAMLGDIIDMMQAKAKECRAQAIRA